MYYQYLKMNIKFFLTHRTAIWHGSHFPQGANDDTLKKKKKKERNKSTASIIPRHSNLCIKVIAGKMSGKKMTEGQITILNLILIISMDR